MAAPTAHQAPPADEPAHRRAARYAWAVLLARIDEVFPLICPRCGADLRIIAFITDPSTVRDILAHLGEPMAPLRRAPARGPPLWKMPRTGHRAIDPQAQPAPADEFDQRIAWSCRRNPSRCWSGTVRAWGHRCGKRPPRQVAPGREASRPWYGFQVPAA